MGTLLPQTAKEFNSRTNLVRVNPVLNFTNIKYNHIYDST